MIRTVFSALALASASFALPGELRPTGIKGTANLEQPGVIARIAARRTSAMIEAFQMDIMGGAPHYGNPDQPGGCLPDEEKVSITGITGDFCAPPCSATKPCPTDFPAGTTAKPQCVIETKGAKTPDHCALICVPGAWQDGCPKGATCKAIQGTGVCTYGGTPPPPPAPPAPPAPPGTGHYGDPNKGSCLKDETAVNINGLPGKFCSPNCSASSPCPTDLPAGTTAKPECVVELNGAKSPDACALICTPGLDFLSVLQGGCPANASCKAIQGTGICTYDT